MLAVWFAVATTMAQACVASSQSSNPSPGTETASASSLAAAADGSSHGGSNSWVTPVSDTHIDTAGYTADSAESRALTDYLNQHRLPLVGAQVLNGPSGQRAVVLYGFVGSDFGRSDASDQARRFVADPSTAVDNRIKVRPELLSSNPRSAMPGPESRPSSSANSSSNYANSYPGVQSYLEQQNQNQALNQYMQQQSSGTAMSTLGMIALLGMISMALSAGGGNFSGSFGPSPYGYGPYSSYPGGSPYGGSPYGSSPFGPSPYSSNPYGPPPPSPYYP
jgi:osmotically-inducible protein OsmY